MRIAHINGFARRGGKLNFTVDYLKVEKEDDVSLTVADHEDGLEPRSNWLSKEIDMDAAEDGYASLNLPGWVSCDELGVSGNVYVLEGKEENGKMLLRQAFLEQLQKKVNYLQEMKNLVFASE